MTSSVVPAGCGLQVLGVGSKTVEGVLKGHLVIHKFLLGPPASCSRVREGLQDNSAYKNWQCEAFAQMFGGWNILRLLLKMLRSVCHLVVGMS